MENFQFVFVLADVTAVTEQEKLAKSLVFLFEDKGKFLDVLTAIITREVESPDTTASTLFRLNSLATKMFSHYSKLIALPYLW